MSAEEGGGGRNSSHLNVMHMYITFLIATVTLPITGFCAGLWDHLFHSDHFTLAEIHRLPRFGSDHFPLLAELEL